VGSLRSLKRESEIREPRLWHEEAELQLSRRIPIAFPDLVFRLHRGRTGSFRRRYIQIELVNIGSYDAIEIYDFFETVVKGVRIAKDCEETYNLITGARSHFIRITEEV
jgi:hypothetical protein